MICSNVDKRTVELLNKSKVETLSVQYENLLDIDKTLENLNNFKKDFGFAITPATDWRVLLPYKNIMKHILVMCSTPGISGAKFMENSYRYIEEIRHNFKEIPIFVDGGVNYDVYKKLDNKAVSLIVMGSYLYNNRDNIEQTISNFKVG